MKRPTTAILAVLTIASSALPRTSTAANGPEPDVLVTSYSGDVTAAGDINGDGYSDLAVGVATSSTDGVIYIHYGSADGPESQYSAVISGDQDQGVGHKIDLAGDLNGDGFHDLVATNEFWNGGRGLVLVYLGSSSGLSEVPSLTLEGPSENSSFGADATFAGDINGDGLDDLLVGMSRFTGTITNQGRALLYLGSQDSVLVGPVWHVDGDDKAGGFGMVVEAAGDIEGDGYPDVLVCAPIWGETATPSNWSGRAYLYSGSASGLSTEPTWTAGGFQRSSRFGSAISGQGDINGDGFSDIVVGCPYYQRDLTDEGAVFLFLGGSDGPSDIWDWSYLPDLNQLQMGFSVSSAGDANGDGFADFIATGSSGYATRESRLFFGGPGLPSVERSWSWANGKDCAWLGDVNNDGLNDFSISDFWVSVFLGRIDKPATSPAWSLGTACDENVLDVAAFGDTNGDGISDLALIDCNLSESPKAAIYVGSAQGPSGPLEVVTPSIDRATRVAFIGDVNGDGFDDTAVCDDGYSDEVLGGGAVAVALGTGTGGSPIESWLLEGSAPGDSLGSTVAGGADFNGDGLIDFVVSVPGHDQGLQLDVGAIVVIYGDATELSQGDLTLVGAAPSCGFGSAVVAAGDYNADGFADLAISSPNHPGQGAELNAGRVDVFLGSLGGVISTPVWTLLGNEPGGALGSTVGTGGDVDGDGFEDLLISEPGYSNGLGRLLVIPGGGFGPEDARRNEYVGSEQGQFFEVTATSLGDINADGSDEIAVGLPRSVCPDQSSGRVLALSHTAGNLVELWSICGDLNQDLGLGVCGRGDLNGDGFVDFASASSAIPSRIDVFGGNGHESRPRTARQLDSSDSSRIGPWGEDVSGNAFVVELTGQVPGGRRDQGIEVGYGPVHSRYRDGNRLSSDYQDSGDPGSVPPTISLVVQPAPLAIPYHWRTRVVTSSPYFPHGPWSQLVSVPSRGSHVRTRPMTPAGADIDTDILPQQTVSILPNPATSWVELRVEAATEADVLRLVDANGRVLLSTHLDEDPTGQRVEIPTSVPSGIFWLQLLKRGQVETSTKVVLTR